MKIGVIGAGQVGGTLGSRLARLEHEVIFGVREPNSPKVRAVLESAGAKARATGIAEAAAAAEVIFLATLWSGAGEAIRAAGNLAGKVLVDCTNPGLPDGSLALGWNTSGGEQVAAWAKGAWVVKAFNTVFVTVMADPNFGPQQPTLLIAGDDPGAKGVVKQLGEALGFEVIDSGPLSMARYLEPMALLLVKAAFGSGLGPNVAFKLLKR